MNRRKILKGSASLLGATIAPGILPHLAIDRAQAASGMLGAGAASRGFHIPGEELPHERTFMQLPVSVATYGSKAELEAVQNNIIAIANAIAPFEPVAMLASGDLHAGLRARLSSTVELWDIPTDDLWCRDSGPAFVVDAQGMLAMTAFNFNGWGGKQPHANDAKIAARIAERLGLHLFNNGLVGEHGGVETDGAGTAVAHESSWVNPNRNAGTKDEVEKLILEATGATLLLWAPGVAGADITDYHIDALARFVGPGSMVVQLPDEADPEDPWSVAAYETYKVLESRNTAAKQGMVLSIVPEPVAPRNTSDDFVASYVNFYVCNGAVIMPEFGDSATDTEAKATISALYPGREVVTLNTDALGAAGGGIHCATHEQPASTGIWKA